jgi:hypothetical protein
MNLRLIFILDVLQYSQRSIKTIKVNKSQKFYLGFRFLTLFLKFSLVELFLIIIFDKIKYQ